MAQLQGIITNIAPAGGYQSTNGQYIYTFQMTIQTPVGVYSGQIGAKTQTYPIAVGQGILVEMSQSQQGIRFKKINPQYAGQQPAASPPPPNQPAQTYSPPPVNQPVHPQVSQQVSIERQCAIKSACSFYAGTDTDINVILKVAQVFTKFFETGTSVVMGNEDGFLDRKDPNDPDNY